MVNHGCWTLTFQTSLKRQICFKNYIGYLVWTYQIRPKWQWTLTQTNPRDTKSIHRLKHSLFYHILIIWPLVNYHTLSYATLQCAGILYTTFHLWSCDAFMFKSSSVTYVSDVIQQKNASALSCSPNNCSLANNLKVKAGHIHCYRWWVCSILMMPLCTL